MWPILRRKLKIVILTTVIGICYMEKDCFPLLLLRDCFPSSLCFPFLQNKNEIKSRTSQLQNI